MTRPPRTGGPRPAPRDPATENVRITLTHPYGKKYGPKPKDSE
jgi:hypothetical protein